MRVELQERREGIEAIYFLIVHERGTSREHYLGKALKDTTYEASTRTPAHSECASIAANLKIGFDSPAPTILQPFSREKLEDVIIEGARANISPEKAESFFRKILNILGREGIQKLAEAGGREATQDLKTGLDREYQRIMPHQYAA